MREDQDVDVDRLLKCATFESKLDEHLLAVPEMRIEGWKQLTARPRGRLLYLL